MVKEQEVVRKTADVCRKHGILGSDLLQGSGKYGGMEVSDARRLKSLEDENARLKKGSWRADCSDNAILKDAAAKKW